MTEEVQPEQVAAAAPAVSLLQPVVQTYLRILHVNDSTDDQVVFQAEFKNLLDVAAEPTKYHIRDCCESILRLVGRPGLTVFLPL